MTAHARYASRRALACLLAGFALPAGAVGLGELSVHSALGEPLDATVALTLAAGRQAPSRLLLARPRAAPEACPRLRARRSRWNRTAAGGAFASGRARRSSEPASQLRLNAACEGKDATSRDYEVLLDPRPAEAPLPGAAIAARRQPRLAGPRHLSEAPRRARSLRAGAAGGESRAGRPRRGRADPAGHRGHAARPAPLLDEPRGFSRRSAAVAPRRQAAGATGARRRSRPRKRLRKHRPAPPKRSAATPPPAKTATAANPESPLPAKAEAAAKRSRSRPRGRSPRESRRIAARRQAGRSEGGPFVLRLSSPEVDLSRSRGIDDRTRAQLRERLLILDADDQVAALLSMRNSLKQLEGRVAELQLKLSTLPVAPAAAPRPSRRRPPPRPAPPAPAPAPSLRLHRPAAPALHPHRLPHQRPHEPPEPTPAPAARNGTGAPGPVGCGPDSGAGKSLPAACEARETHDHRSPCARGCAEGLRGSPVVAAVGDLRHVHRGPGGRRLARVLALRPESARPRAGTGAGFRYPRPLTSALAEAEALMSGGATRPASRTPAIG